MLTAYREDGNDWRVEGAKLPDNIIWLDLLDPTPEEQQLVETRAKIRVPSKEALSEIEASSRLILQRGVLYLSTPMVARGELQTTEISPAGFVLTPNLLVTVRFKDFSSFDSVAERVRTDETLDCSVAIFTALLEAIVDRGADALEHLGTAVDKISKSIFHADSSGPKHRQRSTARLHQILSDIGINSHHLDQARDSLLGAGRLAAFVGDVGREWIPEPFRTRLHAISKDVTSLSDYETHLSDKVQFLLDATLGYISIEQNDLFKVLTIVSVIGVPPTLLAGIWGMNFKNMHELDWAWGYPLAWLAIILSAILPLIWFKRRGWF
ncbi:MAG: magnesium transporter CorA family protein [Methylovirgula sp.]|uniref:magnesium transporter CorA family protein n=1 Tax=Methylovirgula sp. TaxID=1978224 RepID=UPI003076555B